MCRCLVSLLIEGNLEKKKLFVLILLLVYMYSNSVKFFERELYNKSHFFLCFNCIVWTKCVFKTFIYNYLYMIIKPFGTAKVLAN